MYRCLKHILYLVRYIFLRLFAKEFLFPELFIAPRGLITVLLFFVLMKSDTIDIPNFDTGLLLYPILISSMIMMFALISYRGENVKDVIMKNIPLLNNKDSGESIDVSIEHNTEEQDIEEQDIEEL